MAEAFELKGTIKIEGADETKAAIEGVSQSTDKMAEEIGASTSKINDAFGQTGSAVEETAAAFGASMSDIGSATDTTGATVEQFAGAFDASMASISEDTSQVSEDFDKLAENIASSCQKSEVSFEKMQSSFKRIGTTMVATGGAIVAAITGITMSAMKDADEIESWSIKLGISTDAVQELSYIATQCDLDISSMGQAIKAQNTLMVDAKDGLDAYTAALSTRNSITREADETDKHWAARLKDADAILATAKDNINGNADALGKLGLSYASLAGMNPEDQFFTIANAISQVADVQERSALATDIWGARVGQNLLPMIVEGTTGIQAMRDRFKELNSTLSEADIDKLTILKDTWVDMKTSIKSLGDTIGAALAPVLQTVYSFIQPIVEWFKRWVDDNPLLVQFIGAIALGLGLIAGAVGTILLLRVSWLAFLKAWEIAQLAINTAIWANPLFWLIALVFVLIEVIKQVVKHWDDIKSGFQNLWNYFKEALGAVKDFFVSTFNRIRDTIVFVWDKVRDSFVAAWNVIKTVFETVWHGIYNTFATVINMLMAGIEKFVNFFIAGINAVIRGLNYIPWINIGEIADIKLPRIEKLEEGGNIASGGLAMVGERGPELLNLPTGASVTPLDRGAGNITVNVTVQGSMLSNASELAAIIREELLKTSRRLGGTATGALGFA